MLLCGRPYDGCAILFYRKSVSSSIIPLFTNSNRLCAVRLQELSGSSVLFVCVYLPSESAMSCYSDYLNTLGELEGFIESQQCDHTIVVGDFNVDFDRGGSLASLLTDFIVCVSEELVAEAIFQLKPHKSDGYDVTSEHLKYASTVIAKPLSSLFTAILRHECMPECFCDSITPVLGCFLDASKAFDLIDHGILFDTLMKRGLPFPIVRFLVSWYSMQKMQVCWDKSLSEAFSVFNGVHQGSVLSLHLFCIVY